MQLSQDMSMATVKRRRQTQVLPRVATPMQIVETYRTLDPTSIETRRNLLQGLEICVIGDFDLGEISGDEANAENSDASEQSGLSTASASSGGDHRLLSKEFVERMVVENGGTLTSSPRSGHTALIVAPDTKSLRVKLLMKSGKFDIVGIPYLLRCIRQGQLDPPQYYEYLYMTTRTKQKLAKEVDIYGDPFLHPATDKGLMRCFRRMKDTSLDSQTDKMTWRKVAMASLQDIEDHRPLFQQQAGNGLNSNFFWSFHRHVFYLDRFEGLGPLMLSEDEKGKAKKDKDKSDGRASITTSIRTPLPVTCLDHLAYAIRLYGGVVSDSLHVGVTHVVVDRNDTIRFPMLAERLKALRRLPADKVEKRVVSSTWIKACLGAQRILPLAQEDIVNLS